MADEADSKSVVGDYVRVQVPPPALNKKLTLWVGYVFDAQKRQELSKR